MLRRDGDATIFSASLDAGDTTDFFHNACEHKDLLHDGPF
jgi:hypothetical protein